MSVTLEEWIRGRCVPPYHDLGEIRRMVSERAESSDLAAALEHVLDQPWVLQEAPAVAPESDGEATAPPEAADDATPHEYEPRGDDDETCRWCECPCPHDPITADPIDALNVLASKSVASSKVLAAMIGMVEQPAGVVPYADFIPIGGLLNERAADFARTWDMLKEDGRLPEGVRCLMAELTFALQLVACIAASWRPPAIVSNLEAVAAAEAGPSRAERRRR